MGNNKEALVQLVADYYGVSVEEIKSPLREAIVVKARHVAMHLMREDFRLSYPTIARFLGNRDHTTALHGCKRIKQSNDPTLAEEIAWIRNKYQEIKNAPITT